MSKDNMILDGKKILAPNGMIYLIADTEEQVQRIVNNMVKGDRKPRYVLMKKNIYAVAEVDHCFSDEEAVQYIKYQTQTNMHHAVDFLKASEWNYSLTDQEEYQKYLAELSEVR